MDKLTFVSNLIDSIVWPVAFLILVALLRKPITQLIPLLRKLRYKDVELEFGLEVNELKESVARDYKPTGDAHLAVSTARLHQLAEVSPRATIVEAWIEVEAAAIEAAKRRVPDASSEQLRVWTNILDLLTRAGAIDGKRFHELQELKILRNRAVHLIDLELTAKSAKSYADVAAQLAAYLRSI